MRLMWRGWHRCRTEALESSSTHAGQLLQLLADQKCWQLAMFKIMPLIMTQNYFFPPLTQHLRANLTHFWQIHSWICFNWIEVDVHKLNDTFVPTKVYYTTRCTQQWAALKCMFISGYVSVSVNRAFRSCKLLQLISFSHQQQITKGVICSLWTWVLIFVEMCTLFSCYCCWGKQWNLSILYP